MATNTLADALRRYGQECTPQKKGAERELYRISLLCREPLARKLLVSVRSSDIAAWRNERAAKGWSPSTLKNYFAVLSQTYKVAASEWGFDGLHNPVRGVRLPPAREGRDRRLEGDEEQRLLASVPTEAPWLSAAITWAIGTAMRRGEMLCLKREDVSGNIAILRTSKNGKHRFVPLSTRALNPDVDVSLFGMLPHHIEDVSRLTLTHQSIYDGDVTHGIILQ
jgi:integrase